MKSKIKHIHLPPLTVKRISVIFVAALRGDGSKENPQRTVRLYYNDEGEVLACYDPINGDPDSFMDNIVIKGTVIEPAEGRIPFSICYNPNKNAPIDIFTDNHSIKILWRDLPALISTLKDTLRGK